MLGRANAYPWCMNVILVHFVRRRPDGVRPRAPSPASLTYDMSTMLSVTPSGSRWLHNLNFLLYSFRDCSTPALSFTSISKSLTDLIGRIQDSYLSPLDKAYIEGACFAEKL